LQTISALAPRGDLVVLSPHPDDEVLGCGGALALACRSAIRPIVVALTDGAGSHPGSAAYPPARLAEVRAEEQRAGLQALGSDITLIRLALPDGDLEPGVDTAFLALEDELSPGSTILSPGLDDPHPDHRAAFRLGARLASRLGGRHYSFPVRAHLGSGYGEAGDLALDVRAVLDCKRRALAMHQSQLGGLIVDDPDGFHLTDDDLSFHFEGWEFFRPR
jgi:LmbE family N-acetylglucosaminyl deacetylase